MSIAHYNLHAIDIFLQFIQAPQQRLSQSCYEQFQYIRFRMSAAESTIRNPEERFRYLFSFNYVKHYYFYVITKLFSFHFLFVISSPNAIF